MKELILVALGGMLVVVGACHKPITTAEDMALNAFTGSWELRQSVGGFAGTITYQPGNGNTIEYKSDRSYKVSGNNFVQEGQYHLAGTSRAGDWWIMRQYTVNNQAFSSKDSVRIQEGKLVFLPSANCCDIATIFYERIH